MRIITSKDGTVSLRFVKRELGALRQLLSMYPCVPAHHHRDARKQTDTKAGLENSQELLEEALTAHRAQSQELVERWLDNPDRVRRRASGWQIDLTSAELEILLQLLNDVRVGNWVCLGCPEDDFVDCRDEDIIHLWAMDMAGRFQMQILSGIEGRE